MTTSLPQLLDDFAFLTDWEDRYRYLIDLGKQMPPLTEAEMCAENKVEGCMSQVWLVITREADGRLSLRADSDAHIVKGLVALLLTIYNHKTPAEIRALDVQAIFTQIGLEQHLSPNRRNGFFAMVEKIKKAAQAEAA